MSSPAIDQPQEREGEEQQQPQQAEPRVASILLPIPPNELCVMTKDAFWWHAITTLGLSFVVGILFTKKGYDKIFDLSFYWEWLTTKATGVLQE